MVPARQWRTVDGLVDLAPKQVALANANREQDEPRTAELEPAYSPALWGKYLFLLSRPRTPVAPLRHACRRGVEAAEARERTARWPPWLVLTSDPTMATTGKSPHPWSVPSE